MKNLLPHIIIMLGLVLTGCTADDVMTEEHRDVEAVAPVGQPVLFTSGNVAAATTRAGVPYMAQDGRFVCTMYYHPAAGATDASPFDIRLTSEGGTMTTAWLKVNNTVGNSVYRKADFDETGLVVDELDFDENATIFYWQNRLTHAFLALADYHQLSSNDGATTGQGKLKLFPNGDKVISREEVAATGETPAHTVVTLDPTVNAYDLTRGALNSFTDQPDPIMALTIQKPEGSTQEANRVRLYFKHQFSQIQVNLKGAADESATITSGQIEKVELLGVSTEGYVVNVLNADGTVGTVPSGSEPGTMNAASAKEVSLDEYTDEQLAANKWGTSFEMFDMGPSPLVDADGDGIDDRYASGYLKSYNAIAFGQLWAIRVTWREKTGDIRHVSTFEVPLTNETSTDTGDSDDDNTGDSGGTSPSDTPADAKPVVYLRHLQSGMKYIYNLELRRGTLAIIRAVILPWEQKEELVYATDGTITN